MVVFPNVKINLGLHVLRKRSDGYHDLDTCFYPVPLTDILEAIPASEFSLTQTGLTVPGDSDSNLCVKAYKLLKDRHDIPPVKMHLHKIVPMGAGLGGGSSDGAFTILLLNSLFDLNLSEAQMRSYAAQLGSDCPFFIVNRPMTGSGTGTDLHPIDISLAGTYIRIIHPGIHISTVQAYSNLTPTENREPVSSLLRADKHSWKDGLQNDFCNSAYREFSILNEIEKSLYNDGAFYACMSGSGSAVFGLFEKEPSEYENNEFFSWTGQLS